MKLQNSKYYKNWAQNINKARPRIKKIPCENKEESIEYLPNEIKNLQRNKM